MKLFYQIFTKRTLLSILFIHFFLLDFGTTYYVSSTGNDTNSGLTTSLPWKTIAKVNASSFSAGDQILFKCGDTWTDELIFPSSGSSGNPIVISSYDTGNKQIFTTPTKTGTWTNLGSGIYYISSVWASYLWEDGKQVTKATSMTDLYSSIGLSLNNTLVNAYMWDYSVFVSGGGSRACTDISEVYTGATAHIGNKIRLKRNGTTITAEYYTSGTWTVLYTFTVHSSATLYLKVFGNPYVVNPKGYNIH